MFLWAPLDLQERRDLLDHLAPQVLTVLQERLDSRDSTERPETWEEQEPQVTVELRETRDQRVMAFRVTKATKELRASVGVRAEPSMDSQARQESEAMLVDRVSSALQVWLEFQGCVLHPAVPCTLPPLPRHQHLSYSSGPTALASEATEEVTEEDNRLAPEAEQTAHRKRSAAWGLLIGC